MSLSQVFALCHHQHHHHHHYTIITITGIILILIIINLIFPAELGDHSPLVHTAAVVSEFRFVPVQTEIMEAWHLTFCFNN